MFTLRTSITAICKECCRLWKYFQISWQSAHESGKVVSPTHRPPLPPRKIPGTHFC